MKALLPLLMLLFLFAACAKPSPPSDPPHDHASEIAESPPPDFFEPDHNYTEISPNVFKFETYDEQGNISSEGYQVWGYEARQWYSQHIVSPQLASLKQESLLSTQDQYDYDFLSLEQELLSTWNPSTLNPQTHLSCTNTDHYARASATRPQTAAGTYGTAKASATAKSCLYTATAMASANGGGVNSNDFDNTSSAGQRAGASASQSGYCCFSAKALADGPPAYKRVTAK